MRFKRGMEQIPVSAQKRPQAVVVEDVEPVVQPTVDVPAPTAVMSSGARRRLFSSQLQAAPVSVSVRPPMQRASIIQDTSSSAMTSNVRRRQSMAVAAEALVDVRARVSATVPAPMTAASNTSMAKSARRAMAAQTMPALQVSKRRQLPQVPPAGAALTPEQERLNAELNSTTGVRRQSTQVPPEQVSAPTPSDRVPNSAARLEAFAAYKDGISNGSAAQAAAEAAEKRRLDLQAATEAARRRAAIVATAVPVVPMVEEVAPAAESTSEVDASVEIEALLAEDDSSIVAEVEAKVDEAAAVEAVVEEPQVKPRRRKKQS